MPKGCYEAYVLPRWKGMTRQQMMEDFVRVWQASERTADVTKTLGFGNRHSCLSMAWRLRQKGVHLKKLSRTHHQGLDIDALNAIADEPDPAIKDRERRELAEYFNKRKKAVA